MSEKLTVEKLVEAKKILDNNAVKGPIIQGCSHYYNGEPEHVKLKDNPNTKFCRKCFEVLFKAQVNKNGTLIKNHFKPSSKLDK